MWPRAVLVAYDEGLSERLEALAKRTAGAPLSEAEHEQRVEAARARWAISGAAGAAGAAAAGVSAAIALRRQRHAATSQVRDTIGGVKAARTQNAARADRLARKTAVVRENLKPLTGQVFVGQAIKTVRSKLRRDTSYWNQIFDRGAELVTIPGSGDEHGPLVERLNPREEIKGFHVPVAEGRALLDDLLTNGRGARRVAVAGSTEAHAVAAHTRQVKGRPEIRWEEHAHEKLAYLKAKAGHKPPDRPKVREVAVDATTPSRAFGGLPESDANAIPEWRKQLDAGWKALTPDEQAQMAGKPMKTQERYLARKLGITIPRQSSAPRRGASKTPRPAIATPEEMAAVRDQAAKVQAEKDAAHRATLTPRQQAIFDRKLQRQAEKAAAKASARTQAATTRKATRLDEWKTTVDDIWSHEGHGFYVTDTLRHIRNLDDLARLVDGVEPHYRKDFLKHIEVLPAFTHHRPIRDVHVPAVEARQRNPSTRNVAGYPDQATRKKLSERLEADVVARARGATAREAFTARLRLAEARRVARQAAYPALRRLAVLNPRLRAAAIGGAAVAGGAGALFSALGIHSALGKAFDPSKHPRGDRGEFARLGDPPRVTMLVGMPGSGKSTWRALRMAQDAVRPTTIISTDDQVEDVGRKFGLSFSEAFKLLDHKEVDRGHLIALKAAIAAGHDVVIDRVNASPKGRARLLRYVPSHYEKHAVAFTAPEHVLDQRRARRAGKIIPKRALQEMRDAYHPPAKGEFDYVHHAVQHHDPDAGIALAKAAKKVRKDDPRNTGDYAHPMQAADAAEAEIGKRLAAMFGRWTDGVEDKLMSPSATSLHTDMQADLGRALAPLQAAAQAGADVPVLVGERSGAGGGDGAKIAFSFMGRSPDVTAFIDRYRQSRIVDLADEQRDAIKEQLIDAARQGASPQAMARRVRETIGLTPFQMQHVQNYRAELEGLDGGALTRALRDQRFDSPISRALQTGEVLSADAINRYVDAYHRRYLAYRAMTIARTEGVGAANNGQAAAAAALEAQSPGMVLEKTWIATVDKHTRHDHAELNGQTVVGLDTPFECASGDEIRWPHDPRAPARQIIQCRCSWVTRLVPQLGDPDSQGAEQ